MALLLQKDIELIMSGLTEEQVYFLNHRMKIKKKSKWLQVLASAKGIDIDETMTTEEIEEKINDWMLVDLLDGGFKKRPYKCDCGQAVRFQYIIKQKKEGTVRHLGGNCFEKYLSLPPAVIKEVKSGLYSIDLERDEILMKYKKNLFFPLSSYLHLSLPQDIIDQDEVGLPLSDQQIAWVERIHAHYEEEKKLAHLFQRLTIQQQQFVSKMNQSDRRELLLLIEEGLAGSLFHDEDVADYDECTQTQIRLQLPLLERQQQVINDWKAQRLVRAVPHFC